MTVLLRFLKIATLATAALLAACGGGGGGGGSGGPPIVDAGILKLALTDAPACGYDQIHVTVQKVRVHPSATAAETDPGWSEVIVSAPAPRIDLLSLVNGNVLELGQVTLPVGKYRLMSIVLASNDAATPLANAVTPISATPTEQPLATPAGLQGGLRIPVDIDILKDQVSDYVIDVDACNSVLRLGSPATAYNLSPRYAVVRRVSATAQRVTGFVAPALDESTTRVSLQSSGAIVRATTPDATGRFVLYPVPAGSNYTLVVSALGRAPAIVTGVPVSDSAATDLGATPIDPPPGLPTRTVSGTVSTGSTPVDARVAIVKRYTGGPDVVLFGAPADATTGNFAYTVATATPVRAAFAGNGAPLVFAPDTTPTPGAYTIAVNALGTTKTAAVDATAGDPPLATFTFP